MCEKTNAKKTIKIAFLGIRGIPARYGGFETFVEAIGTRLVQKGCDVTVYCRKGSVKDAPKDYRGIRLISLPTMDHKYFNSIFHTLLSSLHATFSDRQVLYYCDSINILFCLLPRLFGKKTVINVDGLQWKRTKWGLVAKTAYRISEWLATFFATKIICDSSEMANYYWAKFRKKTECISYGGSGQRREEGDQLREKFGLIPNEYFLYVSRLEPENNAHLFLEAYEMLRTDKPLVIVGDAPYAKEYVRRLHTTKDKRIKFLGYVFGDDYQLLVSQAFVYLHGNAVGGTNPGLVEAMSLGNCIVAVDVPFNREVLADTGFFFPAKGKETLKNLLETLLTNNEKVIASRRAARERAEQSYSWEKIALQYKEFFCRLV